MNSNNVPDYTSKAKARRASEKAAAIAAAASKKNGVADPTHHVKNKSSAAYIKDYSPPCIHQSMTKGVPRGSHVGHFHTPSLIDTWKQLDNIY